MRATAASKGYCSPDTSLHLPIDLWTQAEVRGICTHFNTYCYTTVGHLHHTPAIYWHLSILCKSNVYTHRDLSLGVTFSALLRCLSIHLIRSMAIFMRFPLLTRATRTHSFIFLLKTLPSTWLSIFWEGNWMHYWRFRILWWTDENTLLVAFIWSTAVPEDYVEVQTPTGSLAPALLLIDKGAFRLEPLKCSYLTV